MAEVVAQILLLVTALYAGLGVLFAAVFLTKGLARVDPAAAGSPWSFRIIILPGVVVLWPWLAAKWRVAARERAHDPH